MAAGRPTDYCEEYNEQAYKLCRSVLLMPN